MLSLVPHVHALHLRVNVGLLLACRSVRSGEAVGEDRFGAMCLRFG